MRRTLVLFVLCAMFAGILSAQEGLPQNMREALDARNAQLLGTNSGKVTPAFVYHAIYETSVRSVLEQGQEITVVFCKGDINVTMNFGLRLIDFSAFYKNGNDAWAKMMPREIRGRADWFKTHNQLFSAKLDPVIGDCMSQLTHEQFWDKLAKAIHPTS